ncbi:MAG: hypothetical protein ABL958_05465 [Bdellovibrionia bacterium]
MPKYTVEREYTIAQSVRVQNETGSASEELDIGDATAGWYRNGVTPRAEFLVGLAF